MKRIALAIFGTALLAVPALGQNAAPDKDKSGPPSMRYRFSHTAEGVLRLDNQTGQVTLCRAQAGAWVCNAAEDPASDSKDKDAQAEKPSADLASLQSELGALKAQIDALNAKLADPGQQAITQEERQGLVSRIALLEQDNSGLNGAVKRLEADNAKLKQQIAEASAPQQPQQEWKPAVADLSKSNDALRRELAAANEQIAALQKQNADGSTRQRSQDDDVVAAIAQANESNIALRRELSAAKEQIAALQKQMTGQNDRAALQAEITLLKQENVELTDKVSALQSDSAAMQRRLAELTPPPPSPPAAVPPEKKEELKLPSREDMERMRSALNDAWQHIMDMILQLQKDLTRKNDSSVRL